MRRRDGWKSLDDYSETLTVGEAAEILGISRAHAYRCARKPIEEGGIPCIWFGERCVVPKRALLRMLQGDRGKEAV